MSCISGGGGGGSLKIPYLWLYLFDTGSFISASEPRTHCAVPVLSARGGIWVTRNKQGLCVCYFLFVPPVDTFYTRWGGGAKEVEPPQEEEEEGWTGARGNTRALLWCGGPRSLGLISRRPRPPNPRDLRVCCTGFCPSAGKGVNTREPPMGPLKATKREGLVYVWWGCIGGGG